MYTRHIVIDLEFTPIPRSFRAERKIVLNEIIQIGAVMLDENYERIGTFASFVKPQYSEHIPARITDLTGITDENATEAPTLAEAVELLADWIGYDEKTRVYSWSDTDLYQLDDECYLKGINFPVNMYRWMDFQRVYGRLIGCRQQLSLKNALGSAENQFDSENMHSALYDALQTAELLKMTVSKEAFRERTHVVRSVMSNINKGFGMGSANLAKLQALMV